MYRRHGNSYGLWVSEMDMVDLSEAPLITRTLIRARQSIAAAINDVGGCDHSVNVCVCSDKAVVEAIDGILFEHFNIEIIDKFFRAEPTHTNEHREPGLSWAKDATAIVTRLAAEKLRDMQ